MKPKLSQAEQQFNERIGQQARELLCTEWYDHYIVEQAVDLRQRYPSISYRDAKRLIWDQELASMAGALVEKNIAGHEVCPRCQADDAVRYVDQHLSCYKCTYSESVLEETRP